MRAAIRLLTLVTIAPLFSALNAAAFTGTGDGSSGAPFRITTCSQLQEMQNIGTSGNGSANAFYQLANDIDCSGVTFTPVLASGSGWEGTLDGAHHVISNLTIHSPSSNHVGLFGLLGDGATVHDLSIDSASISGANDVGILAGEGEGSISGIAVNGSVTGNDDVGGLVGVSFDNAVITECVSFATVDGTGDGLNIGGLVGLLGDTAGGSLTNSYATGPVSGVDSVGGLVGDFDGADSQPITIDNCYASGAVTASASTAGGLIGFMQFGTVQNSFAIGSVSAPNDTGGFVGTNNNSNVFSGCIYDATLTGEARCSSAGDVTGCSGVNASGASPQYFIENSSNAPMSVWDFASTWGVVIGGTPDLREFPVTPTPTPAVTATPVPPFGGGGSSANITGSITPATANVVLYVYVSSSPNLPGALYTPKPGTGVTSVLSKSTGAFTIAAPPKTDFEIIPHVTGDTFTPANLIESGGASNVTFTAVAAAFKDTGCKLKNVAAKLTASDHAAQALHTFVLTTANYVIAHVTAKSKSKVTAAVKKVVVASDTNFTAILKKDSSTFPTIVLACPAARKCKTVSYSAKLANYTGKLSALRQEVLSLDGKLRLNSTGQSKKATSFDSKASQLLNQALKKLKALPASGQQCH